MRMLNKTFKKSVSILLTLAMMFGILTIIPIEANAATGVSYIYRSWDDTNRKVVDTEKTCTSYTLLTNRSSDTLSDGWYVVEYTGGRLSLGYYNVVHAGSDSSSTETFYGDDRFQAIWKNKYAKVAPCTHPSKEWKYDNSFFHTRFCKLCGYRLGSESEKHIWNDDKCTVCGGSATKVTVCILN